VERFRRNINHDGHGRDVSGVVHRYFVRHGPAQYHRRRFFTSRTAESSLAYETAFLQFSVFAIVIAFGHSFLAMSGFETLEHL
jgi:hypothetical protein